MKPTVRGALVAAAVAGMFAATVAIAAEHQEGTKEAQKVHCEGINACKGQGACNGVGHDCAGKNECKGKGWIETTEADCTAKGGKIVKSN